MSTPRAKNAKKHALALLLLALGPSACGRGCGCVEGEKAYERLDAKVPVSLVRKTHWTGGKIGGPVSNFFIRVETTPPFDEPVHGNCTRVDMAEDSAGRHVAFRCKDTEEWTVLRLRGGDRRIRECNAPVGTGSKPRFEKLEPVRRSATRILACPYPAATTTRELLRAVLEDEGSTAAADFAVELAAVVGAAPGEAPDGWDEGVALFDEPARRRALDGLCATLTRPDGQTPPGMYVRAATRCPLEGDAIATAALATTRALLAAGRAEEPGARSALDTALLWSGLIAGAKFPQPVGAAVCAAAGDEGRRDRYEQRATFATLLAHTNTSCAIVDAWLESPPCSFLLDCDGSLCTAEDLRADRNDWKEPLDNGRRPVPQPPGADRATLAAAYARGALPPRLTLPNARRRYTITDAGAAVRCEDDSLEAGAPCNCALHPLDICRAPVDAGPRWRKGECSIHIDDAHRQLDDVRRSCGNAGAACAYDTPCCAGLDCRASTCGARDAGSPDAAND